MTSTSTTTVAEQMYGQSIQSGGGTFDALGRPATTGVAVTVAVMDKLDPADFTPATIESYRDFVTDGNYLGTWFDPENGVWEISDTAIFGLGSDAMRLARTLGERYVYDLDTDECLAVS